MQRSGIGDDPVEVEQHGIVVARVDSHGCTDVRHDFDHRPPSPGCRAKVNLIRALWPVVGDQCLLTAEGRPH